MSVYGQFQMDPAKENGGVPYIMSPNKDKTVPVVILARASKSNRDYQKMLDERTRPYRRQIQLKQFDGELAESIYQEVFIATCVKGWDNIQNRKGESIPFSMDAAKQLFADLPDLYDEWQEASNDASRYRMGEQEADAGN